MLGVRGNSPPRVMLVGGACAEDGAAPPLLHDLTAQSDPLTTLYHTGAAARWRRKQSDYFDVDKNRLGAGAGTSRTMEEVHGVDVSWLHHTGKGKLYGLEHEDSDAPALYRT